MIQHEIVSFKLLSDPQRRHEFDRYGITEDTPNFRSKPDYSSYNRFDFDPFNSTEQAQGLYGRIVKKILTITDCLTENITKREILPALSVAFSIGFIILIGYIMQYLV